MEKYFVVPAKEFNRFRNLPSQPKKPEYERLVQHNTELQNELKNKTKTQQPQYNFPEKLQRVWEILIREYPNLDFNSAWEIVLDGKTWGGSNVYDLLKSVTEATKGPLPDYFQEWKLLLEKANVPQALLSHRPKKPVGTSRVYRERESRADVPRLPRREPKPVERYESLQWPTRGYYK